MGKLFNRLVRDEGGNVLMLSAAALIPLLILVGGAVDMSAAYMARTKLQNACDSAVLAGRQSMLGMTFNTGNRYEAKKFFDFNYEAGASLSRDIVFEIEQNPTDTQELLGNASANVETTLMHIFGFDTIPISVECNARRDQANNDIVLVLDVTGSMLTPPSGGGRTKIASLRTGAAGLYRALGNDPNSQTRYGIVPYSHTVNVARSLRNNDILRSQQYVHRVRDSDGVYRAEKTVHINQSSWNSNGTNEEANKTSFRTSGNGCIEERPSIGEAASPVRLRRTVIRDDIDRMATSSTDTVRQYGRYDPPAHTNTGTTTSNGVRFYQIGGTWVQTGCPSEAVKLRTYASETAFNTAINNATARVTGGTYHDIGMLWGARFISRTGYFSADNPTHVGDIPINQHIVFMTDGDLDTGDTLYSAFGINSFQNRMTGSGTTNAKHTARFLAICDVVRSMGVTVWVIALDEDNTADIEPCATSSDHFYTSDGDDLEEVFEQIGQGIGNLRLTR